MSLLTQKAMLATLAISQWTARKYDREATQIVADAAATGADAGRYNKLLIAQEELKKISKIATEARTYHYSRTLPWIYQGADILAAKIYLDYTQAMSAFQARFNAAADTFEQAYPTLITEAQTRLGRLFNPDDYPAAGLIRGRFSFRVDINPLPSAPDFRVDVGDAELANLQAQIEARMTQAQTTAMQELAGRLYYAVAHAAETLRQPDKIFRDSLIGNIQDIADLIPRLNLTGDATLDQLAAQACNQLAALTPADLRTKPEERKEAARDAQAILDAMAGYMGR